jgi:NitT/TauT family transport system substrate-binding protein
MLRNTFIIFCLITIVVGCKNPAKDSKTQSTLAIATLKGPSSMGMVKLIDSLESAESPNIVVEILNEPIQVRKMIIDGSADFAILPTTMAALIYNKGLEYQLIAVPVWGTLYLFGSDTTITNWEHLIGKRVHVMAKGMTPDVLFRYLLEKNGINPESDLKLDYSFPTHIDLANAIASGQANLGVISEPMVSLAMHKNKSIKPIFDLNYEWQKSLNMPIPQTALLVKKGIAVNHPEIVEQLLVSYEASSKWVNQYPDSAANLIIKHKILPNYEVAFNAIPRSNLKFVRAKGITMQVEEYLRVFYQMNPDIVGGKIPDENFYY